MLEDYINQLHERREQAVKRVAGYKQAAKE
jgi:hypothetical protein